MVKIALDAKRYFFNRTGLGNYAREWVRILTENFPETNLHLMSPRPVPEVILPGNILVHAPARKTPLYREWAISGTLDALGIDVYHGLSNELPFSSGRRGFKKLVTIHDLIFLIYPSFYKAADRYIYQLKTKFACRHADLIIATSQTTANDIQRFYGIEPERIQVVYQGVHPDFQQPAQELPRICSEPYFLFTASFTGRKNHALLIEALGRIRKQIPHHLVLAGAIGETLPICRRLAEEQQVADRVHFLADIDRNQLISLYRQAAGFMYPPVYEGFGIPLVEAMASGIPIAAHNIDIFREIAGDAAIFFNNEKDHAAEAMLRLSEENNAGLLIQKGQSRLPLFSDVKQAGAMRTIYGL
jgi:glycosyltransferase involved in cell wall biosynthesis